MIARRPIETEGHVVVEAENGFVALAVLRSQPIDVVLLGSVMPKVDGYETLERIKSDPSVQHVPVILVSAVGQLASVVRCVEIGATDYLTKPFEVAVLRARLDACLAARRLRDLELESLEQVSRVTSAASALEADDFDPAQLATVAARPEALGTQAQRVAEVTDTDLFRDLRSRAVDLRRTSPGAPARGLDPYGELRTELRIASATPPEA